jgi:Zn-dependent peptidase ImmA (M78 family)
MGLTDARALGLEPERVRDIRAGGSFTAAEYEGLCRALAVDPAAMYRGEETQAGRVPARFRAALVDRPDPKDIRSLALAVEQGRTLAYLMERLGRPIPLADHRRVRAPKGDRETWREGYDLGETARAAIHPETGPVRDLERLLQDLGVHVARVTLSTSDVDAASVWEPGAVPVVLLNKRSGRYAHPGAVRATLAHELCHLLYDAGERDLTTRVSWGAQGCGNYSEAVEVRARAFAPAFLAPRDQTTAWSEAQPRKNRRDPRGTIQAMGEHWGLSFEGAAWHAKNCGLLSPEVAEELASAPAPRLDLSAFETTLAGTPLNMFYPALPDQAAEPWDGTAAKIILAALDEEHLTLGRARELLTWG